MFREMVLKTPTVEATNVLREVRVALIRGGIACPRAGRPQDHQDVSLTQCNQSPGRLFWGWKCTRKSKELGTVKKILREKNIKLQDSHWLVSSPTIKLQ